MGCAYEAVGMQRALDSAIGLPRRSTSASWMLAFLMPAEVSRSLTTPSDPVSRVSVLSLGDADHCREVGHRMPTVNCDVFRWVFVKLDLPDLDADAWHEGSPAAYRTQAMSVLLATDAELGAIDIPKLRNALTVELRRRRDNFDTVQTTLIAICVNVGDAKAELASTRSIRGRSQMQGERRLAGVELAPFGRAKAKLKSQLGLMETNGRIHVVDKLDGVDESGGHRNSGNDVTVHSSLCSVSPTDSIVDATMRSISFGGNSSDSLCQ